ncbi:DUF58 domain-containing protein [Halosquirtibacter laminarini]|uniref:DUF58 domain-containing protein n=1 Tax=Halosquirtibacter laminarini TaxID=3374600 RepID=A0AC61NBG7_9BACT|nr:DUF58 domain-containing protein [Prolixibacteraceae bacterium]
MKETPEITLESLMRLETVAVGPEFFKQRRVSGLLSGKHRSSLKGRGLDFSEVRKYILGDDIRNIDWKVTARTRVTHTKVFSEEKERPQLSIIDLSKNTLFGSKHLLKSHIVLKIAAIHGFRALKIGDRYGAILFDDQNIQILKPSRSRGHFQAIMDYGVKSCNNATTHPIQNKQQVDMEQALSNVMKVAHHDYIINVITDATLLSQESLNHLVMISRSNSVILSHIEDPLDYELPLEKIPFSDAHYQIDWKVNTEDQQSYKEQYITLKKDIEDKCEAYNIPFLCFQTDKELKLQLKEILNERYNQ